MASNQWGPNFSFCRYSILTYYFQGCFNIKLFFLQTSVEYPGFLETLFRDLATGSKTYKYRVKAVCCVGSVENRSTSRNILNIERLTSNVSS